MAMRDGDFSSSGSFFSDDASCDLSSSRDGSGTADVEARRGTFCDQFLALVERVGRQAFRERSALFLEVFVPILFVLVTVVAWSLWEAKSVPEEQFVNYSNLSMTVQTRLFDLFTCYNSSGGNVIRGLSPCELMLVDFTCEGDERDLPVTGLCYAKQLEEFGPAMVWIYFFDATLWRVPELDDVIMYQWLMRKGRQNDTLMNILNTGLFGSTRLGAIRSSGRLYFVGKGLTGLIQYFSQRSLYFEKVYGGTFDTLDAAYDALRAETNNWGIIEVHSMTRDNFDVVIHLNNSALPALSMIRSAKYVGGYAHEHAELYAVSGFLSMQQIISEYYLKYVVTTSSLGYEQSTHFFVPFGYVGYKTTPVLTFTGPLFPFMFVLAFLYPASQLTKKIVLEKETRVREAMLIMGMSIVPIYASWYVVYMIQYALICFIAVAIMRTTYMVRSDPYVVFFFFYYYALCTIPLSGFIATFFSKARLASLLTPLIYLVMSVPLFAVTSGTYWFTIIFCFYPPTAFAQLMLTLVDYEPGGGFGRQFNSPLDNPNVQTTLIILTADFFLYGILMLYLDAVIPKDWGTAKHPFFFIIDPVRWCLSKGDVYEEGGPDGRAVDGVFEHDEEEEDGVVVSICGLRKVYRRGGKRFVAVDNLYWGLREGEISVLLGRNGAGKSTTLNMITGMVKPDGGDCYVYGMSVRHELSRVRQEIGFCPQHNILWPELTCREHLEFFAKIKGLKGAELEMAVQQMLQETDLCEKTDVPARRLSGGQKRKLSVGVAFVGQSRLVLLDEPTAGMDVGARRYTWELLKRMSSSHTILLTTHYMDEADLLGHRIGIMNNGSLQCSGSSLFLKSRLGLGYLMTVSLVPGSNVEWLSDFVSAFVDGSEAQSCTSLETSYRLPVSQVDRFADLIDAVEKNKNALGVRSYAFSATTLEEVFLLVSGISERRDEQRSERRASSMNLSHYVPGCGDDCIWNCDFVDGNWSMWISQICAMFVKRMWNCVRDPRMQFFQVICPVSCILFAILLNEIDFPGPRQLHLDSSAYGRGVKTMMTASGCESVLGNNFTLSDFALEKKNYINTLNLSWYLVDTWYEHPYEQYGALFCNDRDLMSILNTKGALVHLVNTSALHQAGISLASYYDAVYRNLTASSVGGEKHMKWGVGVLPQTEWEKKAVNSIKTILMGAIIMIPFTFLPSNPVAWVVKERECGARHLQNVSGLRFFIYWGMNFFFDVTAYIATMVLALIIFVSFGRQEYVAPDRIGPTVVLLVVYGFNSTAAAYVISFLFTEHSTAQMVVMVVSFFMGFLFTMVVYIMTILPVTSGIAQSVRWGARAIPTFSVGEGLINLAILDIGKMIGWNWEPWSMETVGWACVYMAAEFPLFVLITLFIDHPSRRALGQQTSYQRHDTPEGFSSEDSDVEEEREKVLQAEEDSEDESTVRVVCLRKVYPNGKVAVRNLTFGVIPGEVFGFLGTNGAGKTTTIAMLCQQFLPTSGSAEICGHDIVEESGKALQCIGYCPQFDACLDLLTVEEHLRLYAGVRGIAWGQRDGVVSRLLKLCELGEYRNTLAHELSGGNRRKLSVAIALVGGPRVVFLDEPSAGMDPIARRGLWNAIEAVSDNCSVVLTTHHLEEVEALAHRVAIMVDGTLRCIGDKTHLKNKFGSGYEMSIRIENAELYESIVSFVREMFPNATLNEFRGQRFVYALPCDASLSDTFRILQGHKEALGITDYSVSQTSIEQVFLRVSGEVEYEM